MNPVVHNIILAACIASFLYPIIPMIKYIAELRRVNKEIFADMQEEIKKFKADPEKYRYEPKE
jgi:hypothetical protein